MMDSKSPDKLRIDSDVPKKHMEKSSKDLNSDRINILTWKKSSM